MKTKQSTFHQYKCGVKQKSSPTLGTYKSMITALNAALERRGLNTKSEFMF